MHRIWRGSKYGCNLRCRTLGHYGATSNATVPGFGMTETCAGSTYNTSFPEHDAEQQYEFASVGQPLNAHHFFS